MSHLVDLYAKDLGVRMGEPVIKEHFYPLPCLRYITFHNSDKVPTKSYSYWAEVLDIIKPELHKSGIEIVQIGTSEDRKFDGVDHYVVGNTFKQSFFIIKNSLMHLGIDSAPTHIASAYKKKTVSIYAHTYANTCDPLWNKGSAIVIESDRGGKKPSFSLNGEDPKTIDLIKPEEIASAVFKQLGIEDINQRTTVNIGKDFLHKKVDIIFVGNDIPVISVDDAELRIRMDISFNEESLVNLLKNNDKQFKIVTDKPINVAVINALKSRISDIEYYSNDFDKEFIDFLKASAMDFSLKTSDKDNLDKIRLEHFDFDIDYENPFERAEELKEEWGGKIDGCKIKTGRVYLVGQQNVKTLGKDFEDLNFWLDFDNMMLYR